MGKIKQWIKSLFADEYELTIWFQGAEKKKIFHVKSISKKTQKHIIAKDLEGNQIEIKTNDPFDYQLRKLY
jgi:hypothetical protein